MKKLLTLVIFVAIMFAVLYMYRGVFFSRSVHNPPPVITRNTATDKSQLPPFNITKINHVTLMLDDGVNKKTTIEVTRGEAQKKLSAVFQTESSPIEASVDILDEHAVYQESTGDVFIPYVARYGGSGAFYFVGIFTRKNDTTLIMQDAYLVGDRVAIDYLVLEGSDTPDTLRIHYRDRKEGESMAVTPTIPKEVTVPVTEHSFGKRVDML